MSYYQVEDIIEDAIHLVSKAAIPSREKRDLIYNLYRFHDGFDTSYTRFRVFDILKDTHYLYEWDIEQHPDYARNEERFEKHRASKGDWISVDFNGDAAYVYTKNGKFYFEAGDMVWERIKQQLPEEDQKAPNQIPSLQLFYELLKISKEQNVAIFLKRWYATLVNCIINFEFKESDAPPKKFTKWLKNEHLLEIREFAVKNKELIFIEDDDYEDDELLALPDIEFEKEIGIEGEELAKLRFVVDFEVSVKQIESDYKKESA